MHPPRSFHFIGIAGRAMGGVAVALQKAGANVTGSDAFPYPPMSDVLTHAGIPFYKGFDPARITHALDAVIVGSRVRRGNTELEAALTLRKRVVSLPELIATDLLPMVSHRRCLMIAGTNGKTTTSAMLAWILEKAGHHPGWLVGGIAPQLGTTFHSGTGKAFVLEGDEYGTSMLGDLNPKFLHYTPDSLALLNVAPDHPDFFRHPADVSRAFSALLDRIPPDGLLAVNMEDRTAWELSDGRHCRVITVGTATDATRRITALRAGRNGSRFRFFGEEFFLPLFGRMNVINAALAIVLAVEEGVSAAECSEALRGFQGVSERQTLSFEEGGFTHVGDAVYHPAATRALLEAMRHRFKNRRLVLVFQPRITGPRSWPAQTELPEVLAEADAVLLLPPVNPVCLDHGTPFSPGKLAAALRRQGVPVRVSKKAVVDAAHLGPLLKKGDLIVSCVQPSLRRHLMDSINTILRTRN